MYQQELKRVADRLIQRYRLRDGRDAAKAPRVLVVTGAAASFNSGKRSWEAIKKEAFDRALKVSGDAEEFVKEAWRRLAPYLGPSAGVTHEERKKDLFNRASVEQILAVACAERSSRQAILELLKYYYGDDPPGPPPQMLYEILAHLLRHGFIDDIVTFNFDEALDDCLGNELGAGGFERVLPDSELSLHEPRLPRLLKFHGTISRPESLRFTMEDTATIPPRMLAILDHTAFGEGIGEGKPAARVHVISLGYRWRDVDFVRWTVSRLPVIERVTIVRNSTSTSTILEGEIDRRIAAQHLPPEHREKVAYLSVQEMAADAATNTLSLDNLAWALVNHVEAEIGQDGAHVPVARHLLLGTLFGPKTQPADYPGQSWEVEYHNSHSAQQRLRVEIFLQVLKCRGMVNLSVMARNPRIQRYLIATKKSKKFTDLEDYLHGMQSDWTPQVRETYFSPCPTTSDLVMRLPGDTQTLLHWNVEVPYLEHQDIGLALRTRTRTSSEFLTSLGGQIVAGPDIEVVTESDPRSEWLFRDPVPLTTYQKLRGRTTSLLTETNWRYLLTISESGHWLDQLRALGPVEGGRTVLLISASPEGLEPWQLWHNELGPPRRLDRKSHAGLRVLQLTLPWWRHNRHMSLFLDDNGMLGGIYFRRQLKDTRVAPVELTAERDQCELLLIFAAYTCRALELEGKADADATAFRDQVRELVKRHRHPPARLGAVEHLSSRLELAVKWLASQPTEGGQPQTPGG